MSSPDYLSYKKKKQKMEANKKRPISRSDMVLRIFLITFAIMFCVVAFTIKNYSSKLDIELVSETGYAENFDEAYTRSTIDERLRQIQYEENLPSVSKSAKKKDEMDEIMDSARFDEIVKPEKIAVEEEKILEEIILDDKPSEAVRQVKFEEKNIKPVSLTKPPTPPKPPKPAVNSSVKPPFEAIELSEPPLPSRADF